MIGGKSTTLSSKKKSRGARTQGRSLLMPPIRENIPLCPEWKKKKGHPRGGLVFKFEKEQNSPFWEAPENLEIVKKKTKEGENLMKGRKA